MIPYEIAVPLAALAIGGLGIVHVHWLESRLDRQLAEAEEEKRRRR
jgi:hypothetical protein